MRADDTQGILLFDKPLGITSAGAVARLKRLYNARKAGHTGSLDPLASGMLPICFGEATKFGAHLLDADKTYRVAVRLGQRTASADRESAVIATRDLPPWAVDHMERSLAAFPRQYQQVPPMYSALKQDGRPLYEYARAGITRERSARAIAIHELNLLAWQPPDLSFEVRCSKGAYIRVLAEDLAAQLDTFGHVIALRRLDVAPFSAEPQWSLDALESMSAADRLAALLPVDAALRGWRRVDLAPGPVSSLQRGQAVSVPEDTPGKVRIYSAGRVFLGVGSLEPAGRLVPLRLVASAE